MIKKGDFSVLKTQIGREIKIMKEVAMMQKELGLTTEQGEKMMFNSQLKKLQLSLRNANEKVKEELDKINLSKNLAAQGTRPANPKIPPSWKTQKIPNLPKQTAGQTSSPPTSANTKPAVQVKPKERKLDAIEKSSIRRFKHKEVKVKKKKARNASDYKRIANKMFSRYAESLLQKGHFKGLQRNLIRANMNHLAKSYISMMFLSTIISIFIALFVFMFFLFFNFGVKFPFITPAGGSIIQRLSFVIWILIIIPVVTFFGSYSYPSIERKSQESYINNELPFATIHMASIAESMIEPSNIFKIMISTKEYPHMEKEFIKVVNEINILGYDLVTALRNGAYNSPSKKLSELLDGLATTITSGGDLAIFFEKRAQTLLFDYKIEKEKQTKSAETFMDIYISVVIAAPMILMLLLIMMRISGLGLTLSTTMISVVMALGVSFINVIFLVFLQLKGQKEAT